MSLFPEKAFSIAAPVTQVTLLEDRAQVRRVGSLKLSAGQHLLVVPDVAPVLQDLSLRAHASEGAKVSDVRARRAMKVAPREKPEVLRALEVEIDALAEQLERLREDGALVGRRTFAVTFGATTAQRLYAALLLAPFALCPVMAWMTGAPLLMLPLLSLPSAWTLWRDFLQCPPGLSFNHLAGTGQFVKFFATNLQR